MAKRSGIVFTPVIIAIILAVIATIIIISQGIVVVAGLALPEILTEMPTFYDYAEDGGRAYEPIACERTGNYNVADCVWFTPGCEGSGARSDPNCQLKPSVFIAYYWLLAGIGISIMVIVMCIAVTQYVAEGTGLTDKNKAIENVKKIVPYIIFILILPTVWDPLAIMIEELALFFMAPFPPETDPYIDVSAVAAFVGAPQDSFKSHAQLRGAWLFMEAGSIIPPTVWQPEALVGFIFDPAKAVNNILTGAFIGIFKAVVVILLAMEMWVSGIVRVMATMMTVMAMPIMLPLSLIPKFGEATRKITSTLSGLMLAPIFSALVFTIGLAYLSSSRNEDELVRWLQAVCVCFLCSSAVTVLAGGFFMDAKQNVMGALKTAMIGAATATAAAATGGIGAVMGGAGASAAAGKALTGIATTGAKTMATATETASLVGSRSGKDSGHGNQQILDTNAGSGGAPPGSVNANAGFIDAPPGAPPGAPGIPGTVQAGAGDMPGGYNEQQPSGGFGVNPPTDNRPPRSGAADADFAQNADDTSKNAKKKDSMEKPEEPAQEGKYPKEVKDKAGHTVKRPEHLRTDKPTKKHMGMTFLMGAIAGGAAPTMQGIIPKGFGLEKFTEPVGKQAANLTHDTIDVEKKEYEDSAKYFKALKEQNETVKKQTVLNDTGTAKKKWEEIETKRQIDDMPMYGGSGAYKAKPWPGGGSSGAGPSGGNTPSPPPSSPASGSPGKSSSGSGSGSHNQPGSNIPQSGVVDTTISQSDSDALPNEVTNKAGETVKKPEHLYAGKQSAKDIIKTFLFGAVTGGAASTLQGVVPKGFGFEKFSEPIGKEASKMTQAGMDAKKKDYEDSKDYFNALKEQTDAEKQAATKVGAKTKVEQAAKKDKDRPSYIG